MMSWLLRIEPMPESDPHRLHTRRRRPIINCHRSTAPRCDLALVGFAFWALGCLVLLAGCAKDGHYAGPRFLFDHFSPLGELGLFRNREDIELGANGNWKWIDAPPSKSQTPKP
jgi:hypothetical protein